MLLEVLNTVVYGGEAKSAVRSQVPSPAKGRGSSSPVVPLRRSTMWLRRSPSPRTRSSPNTTPEGSTRPPGT